jgi:glycosyltransferase involved in cell wall biosynthesis
VPRGTQRKIDIVVHGRFFAFDLARELIALGHDVVVYTNYPPFVVAKFGIPAAHVRSFVSHGIASRIHHQVHRWLGFPDLESYFHISFGNWAARSIRPDSDLVYGFSGVMEEILRLPRSVHRGQRWLVRASAHIREQVCLLAEEEARVGSAIDKPTPWIINREESEYSLADQIIVLSTFAFRSFIERGVPRDKLLLTKLGVQTRHFRATPRTIDARCRRVLSAAPLTALTVGAFTGQKGAVDLVQIARAQKEIVRFRFVGDIPPECKALARAAADVIDFSPRVPEADLPRIYCDGDLFVYPTIQDGWAAVLSQAAAAGLPILTTTNCSGPDLVCEGKTGWVLPIRDSAAFVERLAWCNQNRSPFADMIRAAHQAFRPRDWIDMARELECHLDAALACSWQTGEANLEQR